MTDNSNPGEESEGKYKPFLAFHIFMPPTLKKLKGHIALGLSVRPSVCPSVRYKFKIWF